MRLVLTAGVPRPSPRIVLGVWLLAVTSSQANPVPDLRTRQSGDDWPSFLGPTGDSKSRERGILTECSEEGPPLVWQRLLGTSYGICSISKGRLFHFDRYGNQSRLTCMKSETGEFLWKFEYRTEYTDTYGYNNGPRCSPIVDDNRVYIFGADGKLHCLNVVDGTLIWRVDTARQFGVVQNFFGVGSNPVVEENLLLVMVGGSPPESRQLPSGALGRVRGNGSGIVAFDKHTGAVKYEVTDELASYASLKLATCDGRRWCFAFARSGLVGFEPGSGKVDFHYPWRAKTLESVNASVPVVVGNQVFISETYSPGSSLLAVRPGGYEVLWKDSRRRNKAMQTHWNTAIHHEGYLYGSSGRHKYNADLRCIKWDTGEAMWSEPRLTRSSLLYADGHFVCLSEDGTLRLLRANPDRYDLVAEVELRDWKNHDPNSDLLPKQLLKEPAWAAPILSHGLLYVRGRDRLVCLELIPQD